MAKDSNRHGTWHRDRNGAGPGQLFLALIQMIVIPLVFASVILGITASEDMEQLKKLGLRISVYFIMTTSVAITIGICVALLIKPGQFVESELVRKTIEKGVTIEEPEAVSTPTLEELPEKIVTLLPTNPLSAMVRGQMLQIVMFAIIFGLALGTLAPKKAQPLLNLLS